ncbi:MAG TPA: T9SS type A sorting domain-containing protein [Flavipsychrobacter sp.]|nr:T9SS type A sorting domain-containing protein [Flavipsychrobacter sp.]
MKKLLFILLLAATGSTSFAQGIPAYVYDTTNNDISFFSKYWVPWDGVENMMQSIFFKSDFPSMPAQGYITDIFVRLSYLTPAGSTLQGVKVRLGTTSLNRFPVILDPNLASSFLDTMNTTLTTVYYDSIFTLTTNIGAGQWLKLHLSQPYQYSMLPLQNDTPQNLVVQLSRRLDNAPPHIYYTFNIDCASFLDTSHTRSAKGYIDSMGHMVNPNQIVWPHGVFLIGFNGYALSVDDPDKVERFSVFPNPAENTLHLSEAIKGRYTVYDISGKVMFSGKVGANGAIDISNLPPGAYMLRTAENTYKFTKQ